MHHRHDSCVFMRAARLLTKMIHLVLPNCPSICNPPARALEGDYMYLAVTTFSNKFMHAMYVVHGLYVESDHA